MLCTLIATPFDHPDWIFETKFDGLRILARYDGASLNLLSRNGKSQNKQFPDIIKALQTRLTGPCIFDGEIVCLDAQGRTSFRSLQQRFHLQDAREIEFRMKRFPAYIYLFDLLYLERYDVTQLPLEERKKLLRQAVRWTDRVRWTDYQAEKGTALWQQACRKGGEGIIGKQRKSPYIFGRSPHWVKIKCIGRQEFVIGGFTDPQRSRAGFGALLLGYYDQGGQRLSYAGKVGTGFSQEILNDLRQRLDKLKQDRPPFDEGEPPRGNQVHWVRPQLVAEIAFAEWTRDGRLRQPRFQGLRIDKDPRECRREKPADSDR